MKPASTLILILALAHFLSGCSIASRSNTSSIQSTAQKTPVQQAQVTKKATTVTKAQSKTTKTSSQKSHKNVIANNNPRHLITKILHSTIGKPYKWGGTNPNEGFDCSGLMDYVHKQSLGIKLPRTAAEQRDKSRTVSYENLQPGDMLFFKISKRANHVGMYIGDRKFIHAATGKKQVRIASMDSPYWHKRFVKFGTFL